MVKETAVVIDISRFVEVLPPSESVGCVVEVLAVVVVEEEEDSRLDKILDIEENRLPDVVVELKEAVAEVVNKSLVLLVGSGSEYVVVARDEAEDRIVGRSGKMLLSLLETVVAVRLPMSGPEVNNVCRVVDIKVDVLLSVDDKMFNGFVKEKLLVIDEPTSEEMLAISVGTEDNRLLTAVELVEVELLDPTEDVNPRSGRDVVGAASDPVDMESLKVGSDEVVETSGKSTEIVLLLIL